MSTSPEAKRLCHPRLLSWCLCCAYPHFFLQLLPQNLTHCLADRDVVFPLASPSLFFPFTFAPSVPVKMISGAAVSTDIFLCCSYCCSFLGACFFINISLVMLACGSDGAGGHTFFFCAVT